MNRDGNVCNHSEHTINYILYSSNTSATASQEPSNHPEHLTNLEHKTIYSFLNKT